MLSSRVLALARTRRLLVAGCQAYRRTANLHSSKLLQAETIKVPQMAESIKEGTLKSWSKRAGDAVAADEEVATIETDKIDVSVNAPQAGRIVKLLAHEDATVAVGQDLFVIEFGEAAQTSTSSQSEPPKEPPPAEPPKDQHPSPAESARTSSTTPNITQREVKATSKEDSKGEKKTAPHQTNAVPASGNRGETRVKMNRMRIRIAERLKESQNSAASLTTFNEIDMSSLIEMRKKYQDSVQKEHGVKLGFMSAFSKACALALKEIPVANAAIEGDEIVYKDYVDLSVAVATPKGLVTPIVRDADSMTLIEIEKEIVSLGKKARDGKLTLEDMSGGTFTISNGGVFGSLYGTPIINLPQAAVLGMHAIKEKPVVVDGQIVIRPIMVVALTYDHRLLDGREAVTFLVKVRDYLEDPRKMLLV